jgi:hypothetical protein
MIPEVIHQMTSQATAPIGTYPIALAFRHPSSAAGKLSSG